MKTKLIIMLLFWGFTGTSFAQSEKLSVSALMGYTLQDHVYLNDSYEAYIEDAAQYGVMLEYRLRPLTSIGLSYTHMSTHVPVYDPYRNKLNQGDDASNLNYLMVEGTRYFGVPQLSPVITPYAGVGVGMAFINVKSGDDFTKFAWDARIGLKIRAAEHISLLAQVQVQSIVQGVSGGMYIGTGGAGVGLSTYSNIYQFTFSGGISFDF